MVSKNEIVQIQIGDVVLAQLGAELYRGKVVAIRVWTSKLGNEFRFYSVEYHGRAVEVPEERILDV